MGSGVKIRLLGAEENVDKKIKEEEGDDKVVEAGGVEEKRNEKKTNKWRKTRSRTKIQHRQ